MKMLIFSGLVLGSISYLVATQTELLQSWTDQKHLAIQERVSDAQQALNPFADSHLKQLEALKDAQLVQDLQASVAQLKAEVEQLTQALQETTATISEAHIDNQFVQNVKHSEQSEKSIPRRQIVPDSAPVSAYMPAAERSNALMDLVHRMEMKAASY